MPNSRFSAGFTLIELLVTIAIMAVLAAIGTVAYSQTQIAARDGKRVADLEEIDKGIQLYKVTNSNALPIPAGGANSAKPTDLNPFSSATYFKSGQAPSDPDTSRDYQYTYYYGTDSTTCGGTKQYLVCASLENCSGKCNFTDPTGAGVDNKTGCGALTTTPADPKIYCVRGS